ncbi:MAG: guanylate kinase [Chlorobiota bacterium]|nr:guanylate kinase [Chlorobiota bacterium]QQS66147.1 MAG: guanylate kinase [Chlorobiota bacterium]
MNVKLLVISAPSGAGKTTITRRLLEKNPDWKFSVSATTRLKRPNEINGRDYYFLSIEEFNNKILEGDFIEYEEVFGNYYGTLNSEINRILTINEKSIIIFDIDVKGALSIKKAFPENSILIFITVPSINKLKERLFNRQTESKEIISKRINRAEMELKEMNKFDFIVLNDVVERAVSEIEALIVKSDL